MRLYGEVGWAFFNAGGSEPWEFQFGTELIQARPTGALGTPFLAVNGMTAAGTRLGRQHLRADRLGLAGRRSEKLFRLGFEYLYGSDPQYEFVFYNQNRYGFGVWYDY
jgi:hypothetical protein